MKTIEPYYGVSLMSDSNDPKGSSTNPYTQEEFENMLNAGTWQGGHVEGMGYCMKEVTVTASYPDSSSSDSDDSWPSEDSEDKDGDNSPTPPTGGGGGTPGGGTPGGGDGGTPSGGIPGGGNNNPKFPILPNKINQGAGVRVYSTRVYKTKLSTLSFFTAAAYDKDGKIILQTKINGYILERVIDYSKATISGSNTAILKGEYNIVPKENWQKFDWYLQDVPGRGGIAIHSGNNYFDSEGCLLPGESYSYNSNTDTYSVFNSKAALKNLLSLFNAYGNGNIIISITESF